MIWLLWASSTVVFLVPGYLDGHYRCQGRQQYFGVRFFTFIGYNKETWWYSTQSTGSELKSTSTCNEILDTKFFKKYTDKGSSTIRPGFSAWWFLVAIGTWNSYWRHLNNTYSTRARWIHLTLSVVVVVVELGGEENILLASPPSWRRVHHATLEPGRACKKRLQVLLQDITVLNVTNCFTRERNTLLIATPCFCFPDGDISVPSPCSREPVPSRKKAMVLSKNTG